MFVRARVSSMWFVSSPFHVYSSATAAAHLAALSFISDLVAVVYVSLCCDHGAFWELPAPTLLCLGGYCVRTQCSHSPRNPTGRYWLSRI